MYAEHCDAGGWRRDWLSQCGGVVIRLALISLQGRVQENAAQGRLSIFRTASYRIVSHYVVSPYFISPRIISCRIVSYPIVPYGMQVMSMRNGITLCVTPESDLCALDIGRFTSATCFLVFVNTA